MSVQRYISTSFWDDPWIRKLEPDDRYLYLYLMTNTLTNIAGVYQISLDRICFDTGFPAEKARVIIGKFEAAGKAYFYRDEYMALTKWPKHQKWEMKAKIKDGIVSCLQDLPEELLCFLRDIGYSFDLSLVKKTIIASKVRQHISGGKSKAVLEKSGNKCALCGAETKLVIHHIKSLKEGGSNHIDNLQGICEVCHAKIHNPNTLPEVQIPYMDCFSDENQSVLVQNYSDSDSDSDIDSDSETSVFLPSNFSENASQPEPGGSPPENEPITDKDDAVTVWNQCREHWNKYNLKPECRDLYPRHVDRPDVLRVFGRYSVDECKNAIENYAWHKKQDPAQWKQPPPYGSMAGFLKTGVERYFDDDALDQQFREDWE